MKANRNLKLPGSAWLTLAALAIWTQPYGSVVLSAEPDVRRDAVVEAVERVMPCVVNVGTETLVPVRDPIESLFRDFFDPYYRRRRPNTQYSLGSGVIIDEEGFVLTNFHVVNRANRVWVKLADGREFECDKISYTSFTDVALLKIRAPKGEKFTAVKFAADDELLLGETVLALGNPFGLGVSVSRGILSSKSRRPPAENEPLDVPDWLQTDASINPGNSGGPLVNLRGELIGINVAVVREGQGIGFAVPVKRVAAAIAEIYSPEFMEQLWFGARVRPGSLPLQVMSVQTGSPAGKAGLRAGDQILQVEGKPPRGFIEFIRVLIEAKDRRDVALQIQRGSDRRSCTIRLVPEKDYFNAELIRQKTGLSVQELTPELAQAFDLPQLRGLLIAGVDKDSPAAAVALDRGMAITGLEGQSVANVIAVAKALSGKAKGDKVKLDVVYSEQRGVFVRVSSAKVEISLR